MGLCDEAANNGHERSGRHGGRPQHVRLMLVGTVELVVVAEQFERAVTILLGEHAELFATSIGWLPVVYDENFVHALMPGHSQQHRQARRFWCAGHSNVSVADGF